MSNRFIYIYSLILLFGIIPFSSAQCFGYNTQDCVLSSSAIPYDCGVGYVVQSTIGGYTCVASGGSGGNSSFNQTLTDTLYYSINNPFNFYNSTTLPAETDPLSHHTGEDIDNTGYTLITSFIQGIVGGIDMNGDPWYLSGTDLEIDQDLQVNNTIVEHDIMPLNTLTGNIGSGALRWLTLWVQNISAENIDTYSIYASQNITTDGYFIGDGSKLTGIEQGDLNLYFLNKNSSCSLCTGNKTLSSIPNSTEVTLTGSSLGGGNTLLGTWITDQGSPNIDLLEGNINVHVAGKKTGGTKNVQFFYKIYRTNATGYRLEEISTSEYTSILTTTRTDYRIWALSNEITFNSTDRIAVDGYAYVSGGGSAPSVEAYIQGASKTRLTIPVGAVSVENFVPYNNAVKNVDLGSKNLTTGTIKSDNYNSNGGDMFIGIKTAPSSNQKSINITVVAPSGDDQQYRGGDIYIISGTGQYGNNGQAGDSGNVNIAGGDGAIDDSDRDGEAGDVNIAGGKGIEYVAGDVNIEGGSCQLDQAGSVFINGGYGGSGSFGSVALGINNIGQAIRIDNNYPYFTLTTNNIYSSTMNGEYGLTDCYDSATGGQICSELGVIYSITDDPSDKSFKDNIVNLSLDTSKFSELKPSEWEWNNNYTGKQGQNATGLIADDLIVTYPTLVKQGQKVVWVNTTVWNADKKKFENKMVTNTTTYKTIDYAGVISLLIKQVQNKSIELDATKKELADYKQLEKDCLLATEDYKTFKGCMTK